MWNPDLTVLGNRTFWKCTIALFKEQKKCDSEICTFLHILAHLLSSKERLCNRSFCHTFEKSNKKCDRTITLLKRATKKCSHSIALLKRATNKCDRTIAFFEKSTKKCDHTNAFWKEHQKVLSHNRLLKRATKSVIAQ